MSHFTVLVLRDEKSPSVSSLLAPYDEDGTWFREQKVARRNGKRVVQRPASRWDWWVVGGRWTGLFSDYDPETDIKNWSVCRYCGGTGKRPGLEMVEPKAGYKIVKTTPERAADLKEKCFGDVPYYMAVDARGKWKPWSGGCNACRGSGADRSFSNREVKGVNTLPVAKILAKYADEAHTTHAVVTPDGKWHENGQMGWFACVKGEKPRDEWHEEWKRLLKKYEGCTATLIDCHV